jgi:hypothetical protein
VFFLLKVQYDDLGKSSAISEFPVVKAIADGGEQPVVVTSFLKTLDR